MSWPSRSLLPHGCNHGAACFQELEPEVCPDNHAEPAGRNAWAQFLISFCDINSQLSNWWLKELPSDHNIDIGEKEVAENKKARSASDEYI